MTTGGVGSRGAETSAGSAETPSESELISASQWPLPQDEVFVTHEEFLTMRLSVWIYSH